jgi:hypothetical protein
MTAVGVTRFAIDTGTAVNRRRHARKSQKVDAYTAFRLAVLAMHTRADVARVLSAEVDHRFTVQLWRRWQMHAAFVESMITTADAAVEVMAAWQRVAEVGATEAMTAAARAVCDVTDPEGMATAIGAWDDAVTEALAGRRWHWFTRR